MTALPRGVAKELRLARRALSTARTHLSAARLGLRGEVDAQVLRCMVELYEMRLEMLALTKRKPAVRHARAA